MKSKGWFNPTLSFDGFAALVAAVLLIRWLVVLDGKTDANTTMLNKHDSQIEKLSEAVTKLTVIIEINEKRDQQQQQQTTTQRK